MDCNNKCDQQNFLSLCDKIRKLSSLSKIKGCSKFYNEKNRILAWILKKWPEKVILIDNSQKYWFVHLVGYGSIHCSPDVFNEEKMIQLSDKEAA